MTYSREREALDNLIGFMGGVAIGLRLNDDEGARERAAKALEEKCAWVMQNFMGKRDDLL